MTTVTKGMRIQAGQLGLSVEAIERLRDAGMRRCTTCKNWQDEDHFGADASKADGKSRRCRTCTTALHERRKGMRLAVVKNVRGARRGGGAPWTPGQPRCSTVGCARVGGFLCADDTRACGHCLVARAEEKRSK